MLTNRRFLVPFGALAALGLLALLVAPVLWRPAAPPPFDARAHLTWQTEPTARRALVEAVLRHPLRGRSRAEAVAVLGPPDTVVAGALGYRLPPGQAWLRLDLDGGGRVRGLRVVE